MFDKDKIKEIRTNLELILEQFGEDNNIALEIGRITYNPDSFKLTLKAIDKDNNDGAENVMEIDFLNRCSKFGLHSSDLGKEFTTEKGEVYKIIGLKPRNRKYPIIAMNVLTDKQFKFSAEVVKNFLY